MACPICKSEVEGRRTYCSVRCRRTAEQARQRQKAAVAFAEIEVDEIATREQVLELLTIAARGGHVPAMALLLEELRRDDPDTSAGFIDELARRRERASR